MLERPETRYAKSGELHIAYQRFGSGPRDGVLILHWWANVESSWEIPASEGFLRDLASFVRVVMLDPRGLGASDPTPAATPPTLEEWVSDIKTVLDAERIDRAAVMGLASGAQPAIMFAATHPDRTSALVLINGSHCRTGDMAPETKEQVLEFIVQGWGTVAPLGLVAPSSTEADREALARQQRLVAGPGKASTLVRMMIETDVRHALPLIQVPTLVVQRTGNLPAPPEHGRYLAEHIPDARLAEVPGDDYFPFFGGTDAILAEIREFITGRRSAPSGDRVLATVLFTDIVGSTERAAELGDRRWRELLASHHATVRRELEEFRGREIDTAGDGFLATFDGPGRAIRCAQAIHRTVRPLGIQIRAGLHTGEIEIAGTDVAGIAVHIGARVAALAAPGEILVSSTVKDLVVGSGIAFDDRGARRLKGVPGEWRIFAVID